MKPTAIRIERWLDDVEARFVPPSRKVLQVLVYDAAEDKEKALAELAARNPDAFAGCTIEDLNWSDDLAAAQARVLAEHIAAHPEDAGRTVADFDWVVWEIVLQPQEIEDEDTAKDTDVVSEIDKDAAVSETPELRAPDLDCSARSKPWRPMHRRSSWVST
jgi:hypothetical protein